MGDREHAPEVDPEHEVPQAGVGFHEEREEVRAGVVDEHVDRPQPILRGGHGGRDRVEVGHVHAQADPVELPRNRAGALLVEIPHRHPRPLGREPADGGGPDPRGPPGDERDLVLQPHRGKA